MSKSGRHWCVAAVSIVVLSLTGCGAATTDQPGGASQRESGPLVLGETRPGDLNGTVVTDPPLSRPRGAFYRTDGTLFSFDTAAVNTLTAVYFGYTNCSDVCPTTMADLAAAKRLLPASLAARVSVVFVTVDPARDSPRHLRTWLRQFDNNFIGLRASGAVVHTAERDLYATVSGKAAPQATDSAHPGNHHAGDEHASRYEVNHTGSVYVFGPADRSTLYTGGTTPTQYSADFQRLLQADENTGH